MMSVGAGVVQGYWYTTILYMYGYMCTGVLQVCWSRREVQEYNGLRNSTVVQRLQE
jgi:hypothetical protein